MMATSTPATAATAAATAPGTSPEHTSLPAAVDVLPAATSWEAFREDGKKVVDVVADYYRNVGGLPVVPAVEPGFLKANLEAAGALEVPEEPVSVDTILADFDKHVMPGVLHWQSPSFFAYFAANTSAPAMYADMLCGALGCIGFSWVACPAATELETLVLDQFAALLGLPACFQSTGGSHGGGVIQGSASEATLVAVLAAKARLTAGDDATDGPSPAAAKDVAARMVVYSSEHAHSSVHKACMVAGVPTAQYRALPAPAASAYALTAAVLREAITADVAAGLVPGCVVATIGSTSSCASDDLRGIGEVCAEFGVYLHVDAAYAGSAMVCPELRGVMDGIELADSFVTNPHKWLLTNFDCSVMLVKDRRPLLAALSITPAYLSTDTDDVIDYRNWQIPLGRRFRSLKLWFVLRAFGANALRKYIRAHCALASYFAELVRGDDRFEVAAPPAFGLVCFRLKANNDVNRRLLAAVNGTRRVFLVHTVLDDVYVLRLAVGVPATSGAHVDAAWALIQEAASRVLSAE